MSITYKWEVTGLKTTNVGNTSNVVVQTYWKKTGTDENENEGVFSGATPFSVDSMPDGQTFVPFSELTEEMVLNWIKAVVVGSYADHVDGEIAKQIADKVNPVTEATMPWAPVANANTSTANSTSNTSNTL